MKPALYLCWWLAPCAAIAVTYALGVENSFPAMVLSAGSVFAVGLLQELRNQESGLLKMFRKRR